MAWDRPRTYTLTPKQRRQVLQAHGGICHVCGLEGATQVDHITPRAEGGTDEANNLAPIHADPCHTTKTKAEAARGRARRSTQRPAAQHPGLL